MANDDRKFKIRITTEADLSGTRAQSDALSQAGKAGEAAGKQISQGAEHAEVSHRALRVALRNLGPEFAEIGHEALYAFANPTTLAVIGLSVGVGALMKHFQGLKEEAEAAAKALHDLDPDHVSALAEAWGDYRVAVSNGIEQLDGVEKSAERALKAIDAAAKRQKELLDASKSLELAKIKADEASGAISPGEAVARRVAVGATSGSAGRAGAISTEEKKIALQEEQVNDMLLDAAHKKSEAAKISLMSAEQEQKLIKMWEDRAKAIPDGKLDVLLKMLRVIGTGGAAIPDIWKEGELLSDQTEGAKQSALRLSDPLLRQLREDQRKRRAGLFDEAGKEEVSAQDLAYNQIPDKKEQLRLDKINAARIDALEAQKAQYEAEEEFHKIHKDLSQKIAKSIKEHSSDARSLIREYDALNARIDLLESQMSSQRNSR